MHSCVPHRWSDCQSNQKSFRRKEPCDSLTPWLLLVLDEQSIASRFQFRSCAFNVLDIKFEPCLGNRCIVWPGIFAKAGLCRLIERPQGESPNSFQSLSMQVTTLLLLE